jgi:hypothetical protein
MWHRWITTDGCTPWQYVGVVNKQERFKHFNHWCYVPDDIIDERKVIEYTDKLKEKYINGL